MTRTIVITKHVNLKWQILTPISVKFSNLNNFGTVRSWGLKFSGTGHFNIIYKQWKNEQNLRGKGVNIQKYWMIWHGITHKVNVDRFGIDGTSITLIVPFKFNNRNIRERCEICSKLKMKTQERRQRRLLVFLLLTLNMFHTFF